MTIQRSGFSIGIERVVGLKHGNEVDNIAFLGNNEWQKLTSNIASWFVSGEVKYFDNSTDASNRLQE